MTDSEALTPMVIVLQWLGNSERAVLRHAATSWPSYFPRLLSQSAFNRRSRDLGAVCAQLMRLIADELGAVHTPYQIVDTTPIPLARLCRGKRHRLFAEDAAIGRGGSDKHLYYGCALPLAVAADGPVTGFVAGPASTEGRWLFDALLGWRVDPTKPLWTVADIPVPRKRRGGCVGPTGPRWWPGSVGKPTPETYITDAGFTGRAWHQHRRTDCAATVISSGQYGADPPPRVSHTHQRWRQMVETVNALLADALRLAYPLAKTQWGVMTRIAAKCAAFNVGIWVNPYLGRPDLASATLNSG